ncbi:PAS domain S-box protein [Rugamonas sp. CCM 8940]|uniref:sensor histidine kinase n=1 Tax=Rugamonas sp. CCM 8940 TaxID=2765359 RepID=UPI0018F64E26|nr:PAS domain S-box protein [Rugamonas sp. CCM 8940]MBJ7312312.1 PAS domain S-box protein [Rugamonas sp. CCM 8940]
MNKRAAPPSATAPPRVRVGRAAAHRMDDGAAADAQKRLHKLQVSQIELLQQQALAELLEQKDAAEAGLVRYTALYEQAPVSYLSLWPDGRISRANLAAASLLACRREELLGKAFEQFVAPQQQGRLRQFLAGVHASGARSVLEVALFAAPGRAGQVRIEANLDPAVGKCRMVVTDISDLHAREAARRRAYQVLDSIEEAVLVTDPNNRIVAVNPAFTRITGYQAEEAIGRDPGFLGRHVGPQRAFPLHAWSRLLAYGSWQGEVHNLKRDGTPFVSAMSLTLVRGDDGAVSNYISVFSDISARKQSERALLELSRELDARVIARTAELTAANLALRQEVAERKRAEAALHESRQQLRKLGDHLATLKESERKSIAREIHDELGQNLLALRLDLSMLGQRGADERSPLNRRVGAMLDTVDSTIKSVRGIMNELRPAVLDLGLQAAFEWQVAEFRKRSGLACRLLVTGDELFAALPAEIEIVLFRSLQESLTNVLRHARASDVEIRLGLAGGLLELSIEDNGVGVAPQQRGKGDAFGLIGIAERVAALGGSFELASYVEGRGCCLRLGFDLTASRALPLSKADPEAQIWGQTRWV